MSWLAETLRQYPEIAGGIAKEKPPRLEFVSEMLSNQLKILGMSLPESKVAQDFKDRARVSTDPPYSLENLRESEGDILGLYCHNSSQPEIILYVDSCLRAAKDVFTSVGGLLHVVLTHELAHHATASAVVKVEDDKFRWHDYDKCHGGTWSAVHEYFAQALAFVCVCQNHEGPLDALRRLSKRQSPIYRTWEVLDAFAQHEVRPHSLCDSLKAQFLAVIKPRKVPEIEDMHEMTDYDT